MQLSVFDEQDLAEISAPELYPGERIGVCRNPLLAAGRARKREALQQAGGWTAPDMPAHYGRQASARRGAVATLRAEDRWA